MYQPTQTLSIISTCMMTAGPSMRPTVCLSFVVDLISALLSFTTAGTTPSQSDQLKTSKSVTTTSVLSLQRFCYVFWRLPFVYRRAVKFFFKIQTLIDEILIKFLLWRNNANVAVQKQTIRCTAPTLPQRVGLKEDFY